MIKRKRPTRKSRPAVKSGAVPATAAMLNEVRFELKSEITSLRMEMMGGFKKVDSRFQAVDSRFKTIDSQFKNIDSRFKNIDSRFEQVDARFEQVDAKFKLVDARFDRVDASILEVKSQVDKVLAGIHRVQLLVETQESRNKYVLDGYASLMDRMDRIEKKTEQDL